MAGGGASQALVWETGRNGFEGAARRLAAALRDGGAAALWARLLAVLAYPEGGAAGGALCAVMPVMLGALVICGKSTGKRRSLSARRWAARRVLAEEEISASSGGNV